MKKSSVFVLLFLWSSLVHTEQSRCGEDLDSVLEGISIVANDQSKLQLPIPSAFEISKKTVLDIPGQPPKTILTKLWIVRVEAGAIIALMGTDSGCTLQIYNSDYGAYVSSASKVNSRTLVDLKSAKFQIANCFRPHSLSNLNMLLKTHLGLETKPAQLEFSSALREWKSGGGTARYTPPLSLTDNHVVYFKGWPRVSSEIAYLFDRNSLSVCGNTITQAYGVSKSQTSEFVTIQQVPVPKKWTSTIEHEDGIRSIEEVAWQEISLDSISFSKEQLRLSYYGLPEPGPFAAKKSILPWVVVGFTLIACVVSGWLYRRNRK